jgi:hypothetical protein
MRRGHFGPPPFPAGLGGKGAISAAAFLLEWARRQNLAFDAGPGPGGDHWASRLEVYETDPDPDMNKWTTQLLFRLADERPGSD